MERVTIMTQTTVCVPAGRRRGTGDIHLKGERA